MSDKPLRLMWTGSVESIEGDIFEAKLENGRETIYAEFNVCELRQCDKDVLQLGSIVYWLVFDDKTEIYISQYQYTQEDIDEANKLAEKMRKSGWFEHA